MVKTQKRKFGLERNLGALNLKYSIRKIFKMESKKNLVGKEIKKTITLRASKGELIELGAK